MNDHDEYQMITQARSKIYALMSSLYLDIPTPDFVKNVTNIKLNEYFHHALDQGGARGIPSELKKGLRCVEQFTASAQRRLLDDVQYEMSVERTRLVRGIRPGYGPPPPYEAIYGSKSQDTGKAIISDILKHYSDNGFQPPATERPDYLGVELAYMSFLCAEEIETRTKDSRHIQGLLNTQKHFLHDHLAKWVSEFCSKVIKDTTNDFYKGMAIILPWFISEDLKFLDDQVS